LRARVSWRFQPAETSQSVTVVAYCTTPKYGTRVIPAGALTGVQCALSFQWMIATQSWRQSPRRRATFRRSALLIRRPSTSRRTMLVEKVRHSLCQTKWFFMLACRGPARCWYASLPRAREYLKSRRTDQRGNPLGSLMYSSAFGAGKSSPYQQVIEWSYFVGGGVSPVIF
jgi:hypothetical protein